MWKLHFLSNLIIFIIPRFIEISRTKFLLRWVECNIPNLILLYSYLSKYLFYITGDLLLLSLHILVVVINID